MSRFNAKVVVVVGGGRPEEAETMGSAAAISYAREGGKVVVLDYNPQSANRTVEEACGEGLTITGIEADVLAEDSIRYAVDRVVRDFGRIDVLHNNVGAVVTGLPPELDLRAWNDAVHLNLGSVFLTTKHVLPIMVNQGGGSIVNVSSMSSIRHTGYVYPAYGAAKAAVNQYTSLLAIDYAHLGIRANVVSPGLIATPLMVRDLTSQHGSVDDMIKVRNARTPRGRMGTPWEVAEASLFLASDAASFVNGVVLAVDGGHHLQVP